MNALEACTSAGRPLLANHLPPQDQVSHCFSVGLIMEIFFFSPVMFILYMITCTEDLKLFYLHRGNTFKMKFSLFFNKRLSI